MIWGEESSPSEGLATELSSCLTTPPSGSAADEAAQLQGRGRREPARAAGERSHVQVACLGRCHRHHELEVLAVELDVQALVRLLVALPRPATTDASASGSRDPASSPCSIASVDAGAASAVSREGCDRLRFKVAIRSRVIGSRSDAQASTCCECSPCSRRSS